MQKPLKTDEISASAEQKLPVAVTGVTGEELPAPTTRSLNSLSRLEKSDPVSTADPSASGITSSVEASSSSAAQSAQGLSDNSLRSLERLHDLMSLHTFRLRDSGMDALQVVIRPGPGLHLSLSLQMRDGTVDMRATLHHGDYDFLNRHWLELQQQLESRGVRLAPLISGEQDMSGGRNLNQQAGRQDEQGDAVHPGTFAEIALASTLKPAPTIHTMQTPRGWESWA